MNVRVRHAVTVLLIITIVFGMMSDVNLISVHASADNEANTQQTLWICPQCNNHNNGKFCNNCGSAKPDGDFCTSCGMLLEEGANFCSECGEPVGENDGFPDETSEMEAYMQELWENDFEESLNRELCSQDGLTITATRIYVENAFRGEGMTYDLELKIQNDSNVPVILWDSTFRINGYEMESLLYGKVGAGKKATYYVPIDPYRLSFTDVTAIQELELRLIVENADNYAEIYDSGYIVLSLPTQLNIFSRTSDPIVLWEDGGMRVTLLGSGKTRVYESGSSNSTKKIFEFYLLKENNTDYPKIQFDLEYDETYVNDEVPDYSREYCVMYLPVNGKTLSVITCEVPDTDKCRTFEFAMLGEIDYSDFLSGTIKICTDVDDTVTSAEGIFEKQTAYTDYESMWPVPSDSETTEESTYSQETDSADSGDRISVVEGDEITFTEDSGWWSATVILSDGTSIRYGSYNSDTLGQEFSINPDDSVYPDENEGEYYYPVWLTATQMEQTQVIDEVGNTVFRFAPVENCAGIQIGMTLTSMGDTPETIHFGMGFEDAEGNIVTGLDYSSYFALNEEIPMGCIIREPFDLGGIIPVLWYDGDYNIAMELSEHILLYFSSFEDAVAYLSRLDGDAMYRVACEYYLGKNGREQDSCKAAEWCQKALYYGNNGYTGAAAYLLAKLYENGDGVRMDAETAAEYYALAENLGYMAAEIVIP